ncbi:hypothetical protein BST47_04180 [Mycolicibacterium tusciae]|uniref:Uncharacterized protein n=1 Tax=Mycolicibacterium tusciae TaxID=75922 RepID=A0A1X0JXQ8_9MYCO|nr:hypothetical protein BST47_04180 [Mycolicibacterium tusciae]
MTLARDTELSAPARSVAMYIWSHDERYQQSARDVAEALGMSRNTVAKALEALQERGWFVRERITANAEVWHLQMTNRPFTPDEVSKLSGVAQEMSHLPSTGSGSAPPTGSPDEPPTGSGNEPHSSEIRSAPEVHDWSSARTDQDETGSEGRSLAVDGSEATEGVADGRGQDGPSREAASDDEAAEHRPAGLQSPTATGSRNADPWAEPPAWVAESRDREERSARLQPATAGGPPVSPWD